MCGRFTQINSTKYVCDKFKIDQVSMKLEPSYNVAPSNDVGVVIYDHRKKIRKLGTMRWGLIPFWAKDKSIGYKMINTRSETIAEKPSFKMPFQRKRCLLVASGFYEWKKEGKKKTPVYIHLKKRKAFGFAGIYDRWTSKQGKIINSCSIITTPANDLLRPIHDRMPVILSQEYESNWLDNSRYEKNRLLSYLKPYNDEKLEMYQVSSLVNSPKNNSPDCIKPV